MSNLLRLGIAATAVLTLASSALAQEPPKPGPEHNKLKELVGDWDVKMNFGDTETKGTAVYKMELGGLWLTSDFAGEFAPGQKFTGKGLDGYDPIKKQYISVWADSMAATPVISQGNFDKAGKVLTMNGEGPGQDGKPTKYKMTTEHRDKDHFTFTMFAPGPDGKEMKMFSIAYTRRKGK